MSTTDQWPSRQAVYLLLAVLLLGAVGVGYTTLAQFNEQPAAASGGPFPLPRNPPAIVETNGATTLLEVRVAIGSDDAEERENGRVSLTSSDLEMVFDRELQTIGIRFNGITIPRGATISQAYIQFQADETHSAATSLSIQGELSDNALTFVNVSGDITSRATTSSTILWNPAPWTTRGEAGPAQQTPDISPIIQEVVNQSGWMSGNALAIIVRGSGKRVAESFNGEPDGAPLLHITFSSEQANNPPLALDDAVTTVEDSGTPINVIANDGDPDDNLDPASTNISCTGCLPPASGTLVNNRDGSFDYLPAPDFHGGDSFVYRVCDDLGACDTATVAITVTAVADAPLAVDDSSSTVVDTPLTFDVTANDSDADGDLDRTTASAMTLPANGTLVDNGSGSFTYTPDASFSGSDGFTYSICDGGGLCAAATVTVIVNEAGAPEILVGAGDIANCGANQNHEHTAVLLDNVAGTVFTLGDNVYPDGTAQKFTDCYDPGWGRHKARTRPAVGNHDYHVPGAAGYYGYFGAAAGDPAEGYYSYDLGDWHVIVLNSECSEVGGCDSDSPQGQWLQAELAASTTTCTLAYWHHPLFSSGTLHGGNDKSQDFWQILYDAGADVVLNGHEHVYERFAAQDPSGNADPGRGIRQFTVGTGGGSLTSFGAPGPNSEVRAGGTYGVLKLTLYAAAYDWEFIPIAGQSFADSGSAACTPPIAPNMPPTAADDSAATDEDLPVTIDVAANDSYPDGSLDLSSINTSCAGCTDPADGTLLTGSDGSIGYTPNPNFNGVDGFVYAICDDRAACDTATVTVTVTAINDPPIANADSVATSADTPATVDVVANDSDPDNNLDRASTNSTCPTCSGPATGSLANNGDGIFTYTPVSGFTGFDSFVYEICDSDALCATAPVSVAVALAIPTTLRVRVNAGSDDAEERESGSTNLGSSDLEMVQEATLQTVGIRFNAISVPPGATISSAFIQFQADETQSEPTTLTIAGEATSNPPTFDNVTNNITSRPTTGATVTYTPDPWLTKGEAGPAQQTPDIAAVIQEIVDQDGWASGNALVIIISGSGKRVAESFNGDQSGAPLLHIEYSAGQ